MDRIVDVFPPHQQDQIKVQLSNCLQSIVAQQLIPKVGGGRYAAIEILIATPGIRNLIREGKTLGLPVHSSGTIIYQENFDYILIQRGIYTEIQRVPGGQISDGGIVLVSYRADQQPALSFDSKINRYGASLTILDNFVEFYFSGNNQNYSNVTEMNSDYLKTLNQKIYGIKLSYEYLDVGAEYEDYQSNITPYTSSRYFLRIFRQTSDNLIATINGSYRVYNLIDDNSRQNFADVSLMLAYLLGPNSKLSFEGNYIFQEGRQIDLNLSTLRLEYTTAFRQIDITVGFENYNRKLLADETRYSGVYAKIGRRF